MSFGSLLRAKRNERGLTLEAVAVGIGVPDTFRRRWCSSDGASCVGVPVMTRAKELLDQRLARGEVTMQEYDALAGHLEDGQGGVDQPNAPSSVMEQIKPHSPAFWILAAAFVLVGVWLTLTVPSGMPWPRFGGTYGQLVIAAIFGYAFTRLVVRSKPAASFLQLVRMPSFLALAAVSVAFAVWGSLEQGLEHPGSTLFAAVIALIFALLLPWFALKISQRVSPL